MLLVDGCRLTPLSEEFPEWSPYTMSFDDPIKFVDPDGRAPLDYFDKETGKYLGKGGTDEIRFIDKKDWDKGNLKNYTTSGKDISNKAAEKVVMHYAQFTDKKVSEPFKVSINSNFKQVTSFNSETGEITYHFHKPAFGDFIKNRYDMINMWEHEGFQHGNDHIKLWNTEKRKYSYAQDGNNFEVNAVSHQIQSSSWSKTSIEFKKYLSFQYGGLLPPSIYNRYFKDILKK
ncbi:hypothetical protein [Flavobacterium sp. U410]